MDIKFVGSGEAAKAIIHYMTNYVAKPQMKAHLAYATVELAIKQLQDTSTSTSEDANVYAKALMQKCTCLLLAKQKISAQQVATYLAGSGDHYSSHRFENLY